MALRMGLVFPHFGNRDRSAVWAFVRDLGARPEHAEFLPRVERPEHLLRTGAGECRQVHRRYGCAEQQTEF